MLSIFTQAPAVAVIQQADALLPELGPIEVLLNRTGIVMLPANDSVQGVTFHLGEVLVAEAHIRAADHAVEGYGAVIGRDTRHALAVAVLDAAMRANICVDAIKSFAEAQHALLNAADADLLKKVEATRVLMETF